MVWNDRNVFPAEEELIVNIDALAREKFHLHSGDIIEIGTPEEHDTADKMYTSRP